MADCLGGTMLVRQYGYQISERPAASISPGTVTAVRTWRKKTVLSSPWLFLSSFFFLDANALVWVGFSLGGTPIWVALSFTLLSLGAVAGGFALALKPRWRPLTLDAEPWQAWPVRIRPTQRLRPKDWQLVQDVMVRGPKSSLRDLFSLIPVRGTKTGWIPLRRAMRPAPRDVTVELLAPDGQVAAFFLSVLPLSAWEDFPDGYGLLWLAGDARGLCFAVRPGSTDRPLLLLPASPDRRPAARQYAPNTPSGTSGPLDGLVEAAASTVFGQ